ncbi:hypothetical protein Tco_0958831 [Tanacetum coccineum]
MFSRTVFGPWLNIQTTLHDNHLLNFLLQHQRYVEDPSIDIPFIFDIDRRTLELGRQDFCLITGFRFGKISLDPKEKDRSQFRERVFPETPNLNGQLLLDLVKNDVAFNNLDDGDVVRVCLLMALDYVFMGQEIKHVPCLIGENVLGGHTYNFIPTGCSIDNRGMYDREDSRLMQIE